MHTMIGLDDHGVHQLGEGRHRQRVVVESAVVPHRIRPHFTCRVPVMRIDLWRVCAVTARGIE